MGLRIGPHRELHVEFVHEEKLRLGGAVEQVIVFERPFANERADLRDQWISPGSRLTWILGRLHTPHPAMRVEERDGMEPGKLVHLPGVVWMGEDVLLCQLLP